MDSIPQQLLLQAILILINAFFAMTEIAVISLNAGRLRMLAEEGDKIFVLKLHPQMIGRASRIAMVGDFISYMKGHGAWITTCENVARYVLNQHKLPRSGSAPEHHGKEAL